MFGFGKKDRSTILLFEKQKDRYPRQDRDIAFIKEFRVISNGDKKYITLEILTDFGHYYLDLARKKDGEK